MVVENEAARLAALRRYKILDTDPERAFDDLALLASQVCAAPMALITLVDADRQWYKARVGVSATETPRSVRSSSSPTRATTSVSARIRSSPASPASGFMQGRR
ncbi:hypothetical protein BH23ACI1_BH23ACI1_31400 [soil metagenome]